MKYKIESILVVLTAGVFASSLAFAGNDGTVTQSGTFNSGTIQQPGDENAASIDQTSTAGMLVDGNVAEIDQLGTTNGGTPSAIGPSAVVPVSITQDGLRNMAFINQLVDSNGNDADIDQFGDDNKAVVQQGDGSTGASNSTVDIYQGDVSFSNNNLAKVLQTGSDHSVDIDQFGTGNHQAFVGQSDFNQVATVSQDGSDNFALVLQGTTPGDPGALTVGSAIP